MASGNYALCRKEAIPSQGQITHLFWRIKHFRISTPPTPAPYSPWAR